jgi:hypothetical protein
MLRRFTTRSVYGVRARSAARRIGIVATFRIRTPCHERTRPGVAVTESIRKWRGPFSTTTVAPRSRASSPASSPFHQAAGQRFSPIVFHTVAVASGSAPLSSITSQ